MDWSNIWVEFVKALPGIRTKVQYAGAVVIAASLVVTRAISPDNIPAYICGVLSGAMLISFGLVFGALEKFEMAARPVVVLGLFFGFFSFMLIFAGGYVFYLLPGESTVDVYLRHEGQRLDQDFTINYTIPGRGPFQKPGLNGHTDIRGVPAGLKQLQIDDVRTIGYKLEGGPLYDINQGQILVTMTSTGPRVPWPRSVFPDPSDDVPSKAESEAQSKTPSSRVLLSFVNRTGDNLFLVLYNCSTHYRPETTSEDWSSRWIKLPFSASKPQEVFNKFEKGSGWYLIYVATQDQRFYFLGLRNLYDSHRPKIVVAKSGDDDTPYKAEFSVEDVDENSTIVN